MRCYRKGIVIVFSLLSLLFFFMGFYSSEGPANHSISKLIFSDAISIFLLNSFNVLVWFIISLIGISPIMILKSIFGMGAGWHALSISPFMYYGSSFVHGFLEWLVCLLVFMFTVEHLVHLLAYFRKEIIYEQLKQFYWRTVKKTIPMVLLILLAAAFIEVYVSNRLLIYFQSL
ncbi:hypothetical protein C8Z91_02215 [Paenibacillus elgii]|uniref:Stage II sporulation protein M n=1 Tax=Paenibacillus elgii TaxID=189691 RepID=A0A2T6G926_9BACL|nr:hypothetical protein [Paenibacillus elgii]PUA40665.1 hypothetical protein C8Z91_02215 [Paenibacillus elgii]